MNKKKIVIVSRGYPSSKYKMNAIFEWDQAKALAAAGHEVILAALDMRSLRRFRRWGYESFRKDGVQVEALNLPLGNIPDTFFYTAGIRGFQALFKRIVKKHGRPDLVHAHFTTAGYIAGRALRPGSYPLVITEHSSAIHKEEIASGLFQKAKETYNRADQVIAVSNSLAGRILRHFGIQARVVPNIVDVSMFRPSAGRKENGYTFVSTGNLLREKGMSDLLEAFAIFAQKVKKADLIIFGDGPLRGELEAIIRDRDLKGRVTLKGVCSRTEIAGCLKNCDCFVLPSWSETFGVAYIEAMASGLPVIASKCGGPEDIVDESSGLLVPVKEQEKLVQALEYMYENSREVYDPKAISKSIKDRYSADRIARELDKIYEQLLLSSDRKKKGER